MYMYMKRRILFYYECVSTRNIKLHNISIFNINYNNNLRKREVPAIIELEIMWKLIIFIIECNLFISNEL